MDNGAGSYRRFLDGNDSGITEIIRDYKDGLTLYINKYTDNIFTAEELMEETFFKIVTKKPRYNAKSSFKTWLYAIGRNVAIDYIRHGNKISGTPIDDCVNYICEEETLEEQYIREEQKITLHKALCKLKPEYRQVLYLIFFEDFSNAEAAKVMKKSKRQIENLIYHSKISLKNELNREGFTYENI